MVKAYMDKKLMLDEFITHTMPLDRVNDAIELMKHGKWWVVIALLCTPLMTRKKAMAADPLIPVLFVPQYPDGSYCCSRIGPMRCIR